MGVYLEVGITSAFAVALDAYRDRFAPVVGEGIPDLPFEVVGTVEDNRTNDVRAPDARGPWDNDPLTGEELDRQLDLLEDAWVYVDQMVATAPVALRKGPRGGRRGGDAIVAHVLEAERAYCPKVGTWVLPRTPWDVQRAAVMAALRSGGDGVAWPLGYVLRRFAWHVLDHACEVENKID